MVTFVDCLVKGVIFFFFSNAKLYKTTPKQSHPAYNRNSAGGTVKLVVGFVYWTQLNVGVLLVCQYEVLC